MCFLCGQRQDINKTSWNGFPAHQALSLLQAVLRAGRAAGGPPWSEWTVMRGQIPATLRCLESPALEQDKQLAARRVLVVAKNSPHQAQVFLHPQSLHFKKCPQGLTDPQAPADQIPGVTRDLGCGSSAPCWALRKHLQSSALGPGWEGPFPKRPFLLLQGPRRVRGGKTLGKCPTSCPTPALLASLTGGISPSCALQAGPLNPSSCCRTLGGAFCGPGTWSQPQGPRCDLPS